MIKNISQLENIPIPEYLTQDKFLEILYEAFNYHIGCYDSKYIEERTSIKDQLSELWVNILISGLSYFLEIDKDISNFKTFIRLYIPQIKCVLKVKEPNTKIDTDDLNLYIDGLSHLPRNIIEDEYLEELYAKYRISNCMINYERYYIAVERICIDPKGRLISKYRYPT